MKRFALIPLFVLLAGCGVKPPMEGRGDPYPPGQITFSKRFLQDETAVSTPVATRDDVGNILYVTIPIRSTTNQPLYVDYRATFFDRNGQVINQSGWFTKLLNPNIPESIPIKSGSPLAADFRVDFRPAQ